MNLLQYSKRQEERLIRNLESLGVDVIKHYGDREKDSGDVLTEISLGDKSKQIRFDHKSTRSKTAFTMNHNMLPKIAKECLSRLGQDGESFAAISISFLDEGNIFVASFLNVGPPQELCYSYKPRGKNIAVTKGGLVKYLGVQELKAKLVFPEYKAYLYELSRFVYWVKESL